MQGLGNNERKVFLGIAQGKITYRASRDAEKQEFDYVEGQLKDILRRNARINDKDMRFYDFIIENGSETFALSVLMESGIARGIILPLMSINDFSGLTIRISPWLKDTYTNVSVYANGARLNWGIDPKALPPVKEIKAGTKTFVDDSDRVSFIDGLVDVINERIRQAPATAGAAVPAVDFERENHHAPAAPAPAPAPAAPVAQPVRQARPARPTPRPAQPAAAAPAPGDGGPEIPPPTYEDGSFWANGHEPQM